MQLDNTREHLLSRTQENHREKMKLVERQFLEQKHQMERSMESALWELEERQLSERHALLSQQFRVSRIFYVASFVDCRTTDITA